MATCGLYKYATAVFSVARTALDSNVAPSLVKRASTMLVLVKSAAWTMYATYALPARSNSTLGAYRKAVSANPSTVESMRVANQVCPPSADRYRST